jgi:predicted RND superfamily exporter protein
LEAARSAVAALDPVTASRSLAVHQQRFYRQLKDQLDLMARQETGRFLTVDDLPAEIRRVLVGKTGKLVLQVYPRDNIWDRPALGEFVREVQAVAPKATGTPLGLYEFVGVLQSGYRNAALWAFGAITVLILLDFRSVRATLLTMIPLAVGVTWMMAIMVLPRVLAGGLDSMGLGNLALAVGRYEILFNPANIMVLPLIIGIGVAYGIYVVQRYREDGETVLYAKSTGKAVVLSGLTTLVAFGSLIAGAHLGIRSLGLVMSIGVTCCLVASLVLLPALLEVARRRHWRL